MPYQSNTWQIFQAIQRMILAEVLVEDSQSPNAPALPFTPLLTPDAARYGVTHAVFTGVPKDWRSNNYARQCHIVPLPGENVAWRAFGGKVWDYGLYYVRFAYDRTEDWYTTFQDICKARDVMYTVLTRHAEATGQANAPTAQASQIDVAAGGAPIGYHQDITQGNEWDCWGFLWKIKQEWYVQNGIQP